MENIANDEFRMDICRKVMNLNRIQLEAVSTFIASLPDKDENAEGYELPDELLQSAINYTCRTIEEGGPFYTTEEVFNRLDKEMKWK